MLFIRYPFEPFGPSGDLLWRHNTECRTFFLAVWEINMEKMENLFMHVLIEKFVALAGACVSG